MFAVLLTVHIVACIAMIVTILLQRSEGGGLGLGTGGGMGSLMTGRGAANAMTRATVLCATVFITTSITLALMAKSTRATNTLIPTGGSGSTLPTSPLPALPTTPLPLSPSSGSSPVAPASGPVAPATQPSAIPVPAVPAAPTPAAPTGAAPASSTPPGAPAAPQPATPTPSGGGH